jgi:medium-chain acyl-[acyl-carrier-protein] hydrolase
MMRLDGVLGACDPHRMEVGSAEAPVWTEELRIQSYDVDATRRATSPSLLRYFLEAAWNHAEALSAGFSSLRDAGKFWVLARLRCEVQEYPRWGSTVILRTWPRGIKSAFALREFEVVEENGKRLAAGSSGWLVVDVVSKRPQRLHKLMPSLAAVAGNAALGRDPEKVEEKKDWDSEITFRARYSDIDVNQHVNSSRYIAWVLDTYPAGFHLQHSLAVLEVNYLSETVEGEQLIGRTAEIGAGMYVHSLTKESGTEVCRARLEWQANRQPAG